MTDFSESEAADRFMDLALRGEVSDLDAFFEKHPSLSASQRDKLRAMARVLVPGLGGGPPDGDKIGGSSELAFPERLGDYRLLRKLGQGGMGTVYLAEQERLGRQVALKLIRAELRGGGRAEERFQREIKAAAKLRHPHIVTVLEAGELDGIAFLAMEYLPGQGLDEILDKGGLESQNIELTQAVRWIRDIARALQCAHDVGIVHRDVKPSNIRISDDGRALLLDFGLVREENSQTLSLSGEFRGTPSYASPEQVAKKSMNIDARTDIYSLGVTLYESLTGRPPFEGSTSHQVFHQILTQEPPSPRKLSGAISRDLEIVVLKAMEKSRERRYETAALFAEDLDALLEIRPIRARPASLLERVIKWGHRHPAWSSSIATALIVSLTAIGFWGVGRLSDDRDYEALVTRANESAQQEDWPAALEALEGALAIRSDDALRLQRVTWKQRLEESAASHLLDQARDQLRDMSGAKERLESLHKRVGELQWRRQREWLPPEDRGDLQEERQALEAERSRFEREFYGVLDFVHDAQRRVSDDELGRPLLAEAYVGLWSIAKLFGEEGVRSWAFERALRFDVEGRFADLLRPEGELDVAYLPEHAEAYLFEYRDLHDIDPGASRRLVPVPIGDESPAYPPGALVARVARPTDGFRLGDNVVSLNGYPLNAVVVVESTHPEIAEGDRLVELDGREMDEYYAYQKWLRPGEVQRFVFEASGEEIEVHSDGLAAAGIVVYDCLRAMEFFSMVAEVVTETGTVERETDPSLRLVKTAAPLWCTESSRLRSSTTQLPAGSYLLWLRAEGYEDVRVPFVIEGDEMTSVEVELYPLGTSLDGFQRVVAGPCVIGGDALAPLGFDRREIEVDEFWIMDHEVTTEEYEVFLNDPATLREIRSSGPLIRVPRERSDRGRMGLCTMDGRGRYIYPSHWVRWPIFGISRDDAEAYASFVNERVAQEHPGWVIRLPGEHQWEKAARGVDERSFPFGFHFDPAFTKGRFSRERVDPESVLRFPIDESPYGVFDLGGGMQEICRDWMIEESEHGVVRGGCWYFPAEASHRAASRDENFRFYTATSWGMRLVAERH